MRILVALVTVLLIASCVTAPPVRRAAPPPPVTALPAPAPLASDWRDWPQTPGDWHYGRDRFSSFATFGTTGLRLSCDNDRRVRLRLRSASLAPLTVRTTSQSRSLTVTTVGDPPDGTVAASLSATDPLLDAIGFSRGRFVVAQAGAPPLVLPAWAEVERVIEDCRG